MLSERRRREMNRRENRRGKGWRGGKGKKRNEKMPRNMMLDGRRLREMNRKTKTKNENIQRNTMLGERRWLVTNSKENRERRGRRGGEWRDKADDGNEAKAVPGRRPHQAHHKLLAGRNYSPARQWEEWPTHTYTHTSWGNLRREGGGGRGRCVLGVSHELEREPL